MNKGKIFGYSGISIGIFIIIANGFLETPNPFVTLMGGNIIMQSLLIVFRSMNKSEDKNKYVMPTKKLDDGYREYSNGVRRNIR